MGSDFEQCFRSCGGARASFEKGCLKGSKMSSRGSKMRPKWLPGGLRGGPWRPLGGPGARRKNFERFWVPFGRSLGTPKCLKSMLKLSLKSSIASEHHFGPLGIVLGSILVSFWGRLGLCFAVRRPNTKTLIFDDRLTRNRVFSGPGVPKISPTSVPRASWRWNWLQGRLGGLLGSIFGPFGGPKTDPKGV